MQKISLKTYNNDWYKKGSKVKMILWYFTNVFFFINPLNASSSLKIFFLRLFGAKIGNNVIIGAGAVVTKNLPSNTKLIGKNLKKRKKI